MSVERVPLGLTHPAGNSRWFGLHVGGFFFRLVDGDHYLAVLPGPAAARLVDVVPLEGGGPDPRRDIERAASDWARQRGLLRREGPR